MRELVEALCSERCTGRAPGTPGQFVPGCADANIQSTIPAAGSSVGEAARWVLLSTYHDHLGGQGRQTFWGADDNAAALAVLVTVAEALGRQPPPGRGVLVCAFDGEQPPHFLTSGIGSERDATHPPVPLDRIDGVL